MGKIPGLKDAYALKDADAVRALYADWANSYDAGFGEAMGYRLPAEVARAFVTAKGKGPVLDVGAGTGLVAEHLAAFGVGPLDALDLSAEMLEVARTKDVYRDLMAVDIFAPEGRIASGSYAGIVSAGTFTHGHLGPEGLAPLAEFLAPGGIAALSVNAEHFAAAGFEAALAALPNVVSATRDVRIYDDRADEDHRDDLARIVILQKSES